MRRCVCISSVSVASRGSVFRPVGVSLLYFLSSISCLMAFSFFFFFPSRKHLYAQEMISEK